MSKITERNKQANKILKKLFTEKKIISCEIQARGCWRNNYMSFAHRKTRRHYYATPEKLYDFNEVVLACASCHQYIEGNTERTEYYFNKLRP